MKVTAVGECMMELSGEQELWRLSYAGDTFNTLWMMKGCLGDTLHADFHSAFGADAFSQRQIEFMASNGIGIAQSRTDLPFRPGIYAISLTEEGERSFTYWRETSAAKRLALGPNLGPPGTRVFRLSNHRRRAAGAAHGGVATQAEGSGVGPLG